MIRKNKRYSECVGNKETVVGLIRERKLEREIWCVWVDSVFLYYRGEVKSEGYP